MKKIVKLTALLLLISTSTLFAQVKKSDSLLFSGTLTDMDHRKKDWFLYVGYSITDNFYAAGSVFTFNPKVDAKGNFHFKLPNLGKPYQFRMAAFEITNTGLEKKKFYSASYFTEPGDNIKMDIVTEFSGDTNLFTVGTSVRFTGVGAAKYKLAWELQNTFQREYLQNMHSWGIYYPNLRLQAPIDSIVIKDRMYGMAQILRSFQTKKSNMITSAEVTPLIRSIISYEMGFLERGLNSQWTTLSRLLYDNYPNFRKQIGQIYLSQKKSFTKEPDDTVIKYCASYAQERMEGELFEQILKTNSKDIRFDDFYNRIKTGYSGVLREQILAYMLTNKRTQNTFMPVENSVMDSLQKDGLALAKIPYVKRALEDIIVERTNLDQKIINTTFTKLDGTNFELKSLAGKVILMDVWFNGCFGCADFHKNFEKIYPQFKKNKDFVVLSVNVDKDRNRWVKGIESNLYTSKDDYIQVTTGNWFEHPFMQHYKIRGASYSMVIDADGKILVSQAKTFDELTAHIANALKK